MYLETNSEEMEVKGSYGRSDSGPQINLAPHSPNLRLSCHVRKNLQHDTVDRHSASPRVRHLQDAAVRVTLWTRLKAFQRNHAEGAL